MPAFGLVVTFAVGVLLPGGLYLAWAHPDWSWMYLVDTRSLSAALGLAWAMVHAGTLLAGWTLGGRLARTGPRRVMIALAVVGAAILASLVGLADRLSLYGSYETYAHDVGLGLMEVKLGYVLVVLVLAMLAAAAQVGLELARDSRRVRVR